MFLFVGISSPDSDRSLLNTDQYSCFGQLCTAFCFLIHFQLNAVKCLLDIGFGFARLNLIKPSGFQLFKSFLSLLLYASEKLLGFRLNNRCFFFGCLCDMP